jgi:polyribonucleotide nucleotidyltransferase
VLVSVVGNRTARPGQDFFPLTVDYIEKTYAAGRIPGGFFKREAKPSDRATLSARLIDRPIRPLFPEDYLCDVNVTVTVVRDTSFLAADVEANVIAALNAYLDPMTWNWDTKARRNALIRVIGNAPGVAYVDTMTTPAADVTLAGVAPLADAGTITVTVT